MAVLQMDLYSRCLQRNVAVTVILPVDTTEFESQPLPPEQQFPTVYLLHGFYGNTYDWLYKCPMPLLAKKYNVAFVLPSGENHFYVDMPNGEHYSKFVGEELVEQTRRIFPLSRKREETYLAGMSMGGFGTFLNGFRYANTFGYIVSLSPAVFSSDVLLARVNDTLASNLQGQDAYIRSRPFLESVFGKLEDMDGSDNDIYKLYLEAASSEHGSPKIYLACGTEDAIYPLSIRFRDFLMDNNAPLTFKDGPGVHDWAFWNEYLEDALETFLPDNRK